MATLKECGYEIPQGLNGFLAMRFEALDKIIAEHGLPDEYKSWDAFCKTLGLEQSRLITTNEKGEAVFTEEGEKWYDRYSQTETYGAKREESVQNNRLATATEDNVALQYESNEIERNKALCLSEQTSATKDLANTQKGQLMLNQVVSMEQSAEVQRTLKEATTMVYNPETGKSEEMSAQDAMKAIYGEWWLNEQSDINRKSMPTHIMGADGKEISVEPMGGFDYTRFDSKDAEVYAILSGTYTCQSRPYETHSVTPVGWSTKIDVPNYIEVEDLNGYIMRSPSSTLEWEKAYLANKQPQTQNMEQGASYGTPTQAYGQQQYGSSYGMPSTNQQSQEQQQEANRPKPKFKGMGMD